MTERKRHIALVASAAATVLALRCLYLARFGWDGCWMNYNFLLEAKGFALGKSGEAHGLPLTPVLLWGLRSAGLGSLAALGAAYLIGQTLFFLGAVSLFRFFSPRTSERKLLLFLIALAVIPMLSADTGYKNISVTLGAGLFLSAFAAAIAAARSDRRWWAWAALAATLAALGGGCRHEALVGAGLAGVLLFSFSRLTHRLPRDQLPRAGAAAIALIAGSGLGLLLVRALSARLYGRATLNAPTYSFYTFYDGLPYLMRLGGTRLPGEYGRYLASLDHFGSFAANGGSVGHALLGHPGKAVLRFVLKIPDLVVGASSLRGITPLGVILAVVGLLAMRRSDDTASRGRAILLLAFLGSLAVLFVPPPSDFYFLAVLFPVLLAMTGGLQLLLARCSERTVRVVAAVSLVAAALLVGTIGRSERSNSRAINQAAAYLEARCRSGCLTNYLPQLLSSQTWVDLEAGAALPAKIKRSEAFVLRNYPPGYEQACRFEERIQRARDRGFAGPILYVDVRTASTRVFDDSFDPEHRFDGGLDPSRLTLEQRLEQDGDLVSIYRVDAPRSAKQ